MSTLALAMPPLSVSALLSMMGLFLALALGAGHLFAADTNTKSTLVTLTAASQSLPKCLKIFNSSSPMTKRERAQLRAFRASLIEAARLIAGTLLIAVAVVSLPFLFAIL